MNYTKKLVKLLRCTFLTVVVILGLVTIIGTGESDNSGGSGKDTTNFDEVQEARPEYLPGTAASTSTSHESVSGRGLPGQDLTLTLDDQTRAEIPKLDQPYDAWLEKDSLSASAAAQRIVDDLDAEAGLSPTGALRQLTILGSGDPSALKPLITIPASETGTINPVTINVLRVGDAYVDGVLRSNFAMTLSVTTDNHGNLQFVDPLMRDAVRPTGMAKSLGASNPEGHSLNATPQGGATGNWQANATYILMSFQGNLNWNRPPYLIRMIPQPGNAASGYRRPATSEELAELSKKPICNVVLLVHGHNEEEKGGGSVATSERAPWLFHYKRLVWDLFYREITQPKTYNDGEITNYPYECTAFYEFIYPTYRPIFSEVVDGTGTRHETLGGALGTMIQQELVNDPQLKAMIQNEMPFNAIIVGHSQGGLVARAGMRDMPQEFKDRAVRYISWGSPHRGAALYTLRYAFQSGHDMIIGGRRLPLSEINNCWFFGSRYQDALDAHVAIDAPGIRDLRWEFALKDMLNMNLLFPSIRDDSQLPIPLYSRNLTAFNADTSREKIAGGYTFIVGNTSKRVDLDFDDLFEAWYFTTGSTSIEQGATLNEYLMRSNWEKQNDGAVPIYSQEAEDISFGSPVKVLYMGDIDHEEFYGAEPGQRTPEALALGRETAHRTFDEAGLKHPSRGCPEIDAEAQFNEDRVRISGNISFPIYEVNHGGDGLLGRRIQRIEARRDNQEGRILDALSFTHDSNGSFQAVGNARDLPDSGIVVVAVFKDGSEIVTELDPVSVSILPPRIILVELQGGTTEYSDTFEAVARPAGAYRFKWNFGDGNTITETRQPGELSQVSNTFRGLEEGDKFYPEVTIYSEHGTQPLARDSISITVSVADSTVPNTWVLDRVTVTDGCESDDYMQSSHSDGWWQVAGPNNSGSGTWNPPMPESLRSGQTIEMSVTAIASGINSHFYQTRMGVFFGNGHGDITYSLPGVPRRTIVSASADQNGETGATGSLLVPESDNCGNNHRCNTIIIRAGRGHGLICQIGYTYRYRLQE